MLYEKYRPLNYNDMIGQDRAVKVAKRLTTSPGYDRGAFWIEGSGANNSGIGKTSLANCIALSLADDFFVTRVSGREINATYVDHIRNGAGLLTWGEKRFRIWIIDEAHAITKSGVDAMLPFLEQLPVHTVIIFTTTRVVDKDLFGDDCGAFSSRTIRIKLTNQGLCECFAKRAKFIAELEELADRNKPISAYKRLVQDCKNNFRSVLQQIESGCMLTD